MKRIIVCRIMENSIRLKRVDENLILDLIGNKINTLEFDLNIKHINSFKNFKKLFINIANLSEINNDTINKFYKLKNAVKDKNISFINVNAMNNCVLNLFKIDKSFQLYMTMQDAIEARKPIINRQFKIVS